MSALRAERGVSCHQDTRPHPHPDTPQQIAISQTVISQTVISAQHGDSEAFRTLYDTYAPRLLGYLQSLVGENDAEDVASETWSRIHAALSTYRHQRGDFRAWATTIARNQAISHLRYRRTRPADPTAPEAFPHLPSHTDTERDAAEAIGTTRALQLLRELPHTQAKAVILCVIIGMDAATAGHILRKQPSAVRMAAHRGLKALRQLLDSR